MFHIPMGLADPPSSHGVILLGDPKGDRQRDGKKEAVWQTEADGQIDGQIARWTIRLVRWTRYVNGWMDGYGWMDMDGYGWIWMDMGGCRWIWMDMGGFGWTWMDMDGYGWMQMDMDGYGWVWMDMGGCRWIWTDVYGYGWLWMDMVGY